MQKTKTLIVWNYMLIVLTNILQYCSFLNSSNEYLIWCSTYCCWKGIGCWLLGAAFMVRVMCAMLVLGTYEAGPCGKTCWGMGRCGTRACPLPCPFTGPDGWEELGCVVCSHNFPFDPGLHTHICGLRHMPPFWHFGRQFAGKQKEK